MAAAGRLRRRFVLSTFGLLSPGKGIENVLLALPAIIEPHPETLYVVAGRTHPGVAQREGERYRLSLQQLVTELGLSEHVEFDDRFLAIDEIADLLATTSVFVTPYLDPDQTSSGALTFAIAAGCAVVSTPYRYAEDMLASGAGELVPFADPGAFSSPSAGSSRSGAARRGPHRGTPHRRGRQLAGGRGRDRRGAPRRDGAHATPRIRRQPRAAACKFPARPSPDDGRRRRDRAARARCNSEPAKRLLRRRCRAARGRRARARAPVRRAALDSDRLPLAGVPA